MTPPVFRVDRLPEPGSVVELAGAEGRHAGSAVRVRPGEHIVVGDGAGTTADCVVQSAEAGLVRARVGSVRRHRTPSPRVTVVQALPKSERSELAVELATEAGADEVVPWQAARCVSRWSGPKIDKGVTKWRNAARAAAKQSRRPWEPVVHAPVDTAGVDELVAEYVRSGDLALVLHEQGAVPFRDAVLAAGAPGRVLLVVGPEGGIDPEELARLTASGARAVLLGPEVLRTSTAAAVALGALGVLTGRWDADEAPAVPTTLGTSDPPTRE